MVSRGAKRMIDAECEECGKPWNSEYHMGDQCVNLNEDQDE